MMLPAATEAAFRRTTYWVRGQPVRIGRRCAVVDDLLRRLGVRQALVVTAWNPLSRRMPREWNDRMQARLVLALRRGVTCPAHGGHGRWSEDHLMLAGDPRPGVVQLRRFRQWAGVHLRRGVPARLWVLEWPKSAIAPSGRER